MRLAALCLLLTGCASYPYAEVGLGVVHERSTSYVLRPGCDFVSTPDGEKSCGGRNPTAHIRFGLEFEDGWVDRCELAHDSHLRDGFPFNDRGEWYVNELVCLKKWGGRDARR